MEATTQTAPDARAYVLVIDESVTGGLRRAFEELARRVTETADAMAVAMRPFVELAERVTSTLRGAVETFDDIEPLRWPGVRETHFPPETRDERRRTAETPITRAIARTPIRPTKQRAPRRDRRSCSRALLGRAHPMNRSGRAPLGR